MEIGNGVRITDIGQIYSTYDAMAQDMNLPHWESGTTGDRFYDRIFTILDVQNHPDGGDHYIYGIDDGNTSLLVSADGIEAISARRPPIDRHKESEKYWKAKEKLGKKNNLLEEAVDDGV